MRVKVIVTSHTRWEGVVDADDEEDAVRRAKFHALFDGDYEEQEAEWEVLPDPPTLPILAVVSKKPARPSRFGRAQKRHTYAE